MKSSKWVIGLVFGIALLQTGGAFADSSKPVVSATNKDDFTAVAAAIRQQVAPGGRWEYTNSLEKEQINHDLNDMQALFDKYGTVDQMDQASKLQLLNDQEAVNEILTKRDNNHLVCTNEAPLGSLIPKRTCRTYGEIERERSDSQKFMRDRMATPQLRHGGG